MELLVMLLLIAAVAALIAAPLVRPPAEDPPAALPTDGGTDARRRAALAAIKELEFDYATGKLAEDDYRMLRRRYEARAAAVLAEASAQPPRSGAARPAATDDALEAEIRAARRRRACPSCGGRLPGAARFCPSCGRAVEVQA
jgi:hypothetical protein